MNTTLAQQIELSNSVQTAVIDRLMKFGVSLETRQEMIIKYNGNTAEYFTGPDYFHDHHMSPLGNKEKMISHFSDHLAHLYKCGYIDEETLNFPFRVSSDALSIVVE
ncbi:hypothetical protein [Streptomyces sp. NPDC047972]|uniref:hypothetical protein n=1 Tax=Streptomyces sp. NPDC047972 TaxID=3365493 RepID=UPI003711F741